MNVAYQIKHGRLFIQHAPEIGAIETRDLGIPYPRVRVRNKVQV